MESLMPAVRRQCEVRAEAIFPGSWLAFSFEHRDHRPRFDLRLGVSLAREVALSMSIRRYRGLLCDRDGLASQVSRDASVHWG